MLSDTHFRDLEAALEDRSHVTVSAEVLRQLLAATSVANAAVAVERDEWDRCKAARLSPSGAILESSHPHRSRSDWRFARALARYTQPQTQQVNA